MLREFTSHVGARGQITSPAEVRKQMGIRPRDRVTIEVDRGVITITPARPSLAASFQAVPALAQPHSIEEMTEIAADEMAHEAAGEGL